MDRHSILLTATEAALAAGARIREIRDRNEITVNFKAEKDLVTNADMAAERIIVDCISKRFSHHGYLTEESAPRVLSSADLQGPLWIIDPIDGTANYAHGMDHVAVSIAYAEAGSVEVAIVHNPFRLETYTATRGGGAYCDEKPIVPCRTTEELKDAIVATGYPGWRTEIDRMMAQTRTVLTHCRDIRRLGSAALDTCWVACGKLDGYWESVKAWDIAAAGLIAREAGAKTGHFYRDECSALPVELEGENFVVGAPGIFERLKAILAATIPSSAAE